ncbi:MAG: hypothetical protein SGI83_13765 [Bacteroidota bacterium]|nr:hypothetical protein [Bacteroidota bacterium]
MKKVLLSIHIVLASSNCHSQSNNIVGVWLWRDSKTSFSLLINEDGTIETFSRPINDPTPAKNRKKGTFKFIDNKKLVITWADKSTETDKVKFIDNGTLKIELNNPEDHNLKIYTFKKVFDEEVEFKENQLLQHWVLLYGG